MKMASPKSLPFSPAVCGHWTPSVFRHLNSALTIYYYAKDKQVDNLVGYIIKILKDGFNEPKKNIPKTKKDFIERDYDYDELERKLLGWDK